jgi:hypothetical protein
MRSSTSRPFVAFDLLGRLVANALMGIVNIDLIFRPHTN